jgi:4-amino-4-deoxy-L-arabinose transferase-like glycosyltransferase
VTFLQNYRSWLPLPLILLLAASLRLYGISDRNYWLDEFWTAELSTGRGSVHLNIPTNTIIDPPPATTSLVNAPRATKVWSTMQDATHPPLYFFALRIWRNIAGEGDATSRLLSVLCSLAAIAFLYDTTLRLHGGAIAIWASLIMALAVPQIEYAQATRNYAFLLMVSLAACSALIRIEQLGPRLPYLIWLAAALLATALSHYFAMGALISLFSYSLLRLRGPIRLKVAATFLITALLYLILWAPHLWTHLHTFSSPERTTIFLYSKEPHHPLLILELLVSLPPILFIGSQTISLFWLMLSGAIIIVLIFFPLALRKYRRPELLIWYLWLAGTIGFLAALDLLRTTHQLGFVRYTLLASPALYVLIAAVPTQLGRIASHGIPAAAALFCALFLPSVYKDSHVDFRELAALLDQAGPRDLLIFAAPSKYSGAPADLYLGYSHYSNPRQRPPILIMTDTLPPDVRAQLDKFPHVWLINASPEILPTQLLPDYAFLGPAQTSFPATIWQVVPKPQAKTQPSTKR